MTDQSGDPDRAIMVTFADGTIRYYISELSINTQNGNNLEIRRKYTENGKEASQIAVYAPAGTWIRVERTNLIAKEPNA